jgi:hypothetical protein
LWVIAAMAVLVAPTVEVETSKVPVDVVVAVWVPVAVVEPSVLVAAVTPVPVLVPVSVELEVELVLEFDFEQTTSLGRSVTPPRAQMDLATLMVAVLRKDSSLARCMSYSMLIAPLAHSTGDGAGITYCPGLLWSTYQRRSMRHRRGRIWIRKCT